MDLVSPAITATTCDRVGNLDDALAHLRACVAGPELIVLVQSRPGEFSPEAIDSLRRAAPLARIDRLLGSWCEGEQRSDRTPSGCTASYWHQWHSREGRQSTATRAHRRAAWSMPITTSADERLLAATDEAVVRGSGLIVICAAGRETAEALADACRLGGYTICVVHDAGRFSVTGARAVLWDTSVDCAADGRRVRSLRQAAGGAPLLALLGFPRADDVRQAYGAGVAAVISKPFLLRDLLWQLGATVRHAE
jgi:CheY-like chemotaxis protein